ncbi:MAG: hypothetical protein Q9168_004218 [Polycauliona sp. 1 TL-2023]
MNEKVASKPPINLLKGWPNPGLLPVAQIKAASASALSDPDISTPALLYGPDPGFEPLREAIAEWLSRFYKKHLEADIHPERICITGGASQNLACVLQVFSDPVYTKYVWMVSPTYFRVCPIFEDNAFSGRLRSVPEDDEGIDVDFLRQRLEEDHQNSTGDQPGGISWTSQPHNTSRGVPSNEKTKSRTLKGSQPWRKAYRHIIYAVPTFSNPSSRTMTLRRRHELVRIARQYDALILADDVYDQLQWPSNQGAKQSACDDASITLRHALLPRLVDIDRWLEGGPTRHGADGFGNVVSNGSFSKIAAPGLRCGWAEGSDLFIWGLSKCGSSASGGAPSQAVSTFMTQLLSSGALENHIYTTLQPSYARRYNNIMSAITRYLLPLDVRLPQSDRDVVGGYFLYLELPKSLVADTVAQRAKADENLIIGQGPLFAVYGDERKDLERQVRVCFSWESEENLNEGIERLATVIRDRRALSMIVFAPGSEFDVHTVQSLNDGRPVTVRHWRDDGSSDDEDERNPPRKRSRIGGSENMAWESSAQTNPGVRGLGNNWVFDYGTLNSLDRPSSAATGLSRFYDSVIDTATTKLANGTVESTDMVFASKGLSLKFSSSESIEWLWVVRFVEAMEAALTRGFTVLYDNVIAENVVWEVATILITLSVTKRISG